jgi:hypothetical protein
MGRIACDLWRTILVRLSEGWFDLHAGCDEVFVRTTAARRLT